jgi:hypothetical protein
MRFIAWRRRMSIRHYLRPLPNEDHRPQEGLRIFEAPRCEDVFVICESPLLEFTHKDLVFMRELKIDPFTEVE